MIHPLDGAEERRAAHDELSPYLAPHVAFLLPEDFQLDFVLGRLLDELQDGDTFRENDQNC